MHAGQHLIEHSTLVATLATMAEWMGDEMPRWRAIAARHQEFIRNRIPSGWRLSEALLKSVPALDLPRQSGILSDWELGITESKAVDILAGLRDQKFKAVDVTRAFCKRAAIAQQSVGCRIWGVGGLC